jgi:hypothetical protein
MKKVFLLGCPRSGTTWLQLLLYQHPEVNTLQETHLFAWYVSTLYKIFQTDRDNVRKRNVGISEIISKEKFDKILSEFVETILFKNRLILDTCEVVVEKTPDHVKHWKIINRLIPDALFIHIIRDPRSVVASMLAAKKQWGSETAPFGGAVGAAYRWVNDVAIGLELRLIHERYYETKYEILKTNGPKELQKIFNFIGVSSEELLCNKIYDSCQISKLKNLNRKIISPWDLSKEPKQFFRNGEIEGWKQDLNDSDIRIIEFISKSIMDTLGYQRIKKNCVKPIRIIYYDLLLNFNKIVKKLLKRFGPKKYL